MGWPMPPGLRAALVRVGIFALFAVLGYVFIPWLIYPVAGVLVAATLGTFATASIANALCLRIFERARLSDIGLGWTAASRHNVCIGLLGGIVAGAIVVLVPVAVRAADFVSIPVTTDNWRTLLFVSVVLVFGAVGEEMLFRGYAFQVLVRATGPFATILPVSLLFALAHSWNQNITLLALFNTFLWGVLLGYSFLRSGDLWLPIGLHFGWNWVLPVLGVNLSGFTMGVTGYAMRWKMGGLWLSGGAYGPEAGVLTTVIVVLLYFYLEKVSIQPQEPYLLLKDRMVFKDHE